MIVRARLAWAALFTACALATAVETASANQLSLSHQSFRFVTEPAVFSSLGVGAVMVACPFVVEGTFHEATFAKDVALTGHVTRAIVDSAECNEPGELGTRVSVLEATLPWHLVYSGYTGLLPVITGIRVAIGLAALAARFAGQECLYQGLLYGYFNVGTANIIRTFRWEEATLIALSRGGFLCPSQVKLSGEAPVTELEGPEPVLLTLI